MYYQNLIALGRATQDSEIIESKKGQPFLTFSLAVNRYMGKEHGEEVTYYDCLFFAKDKERLDKQSAKIKKGDLVLVQGRPEADAYMGKDKKPKAQLKVIVNELQALK